MSTAADPDPDRSDGVAYLGFYVGFFVLVAEMRKYQREWFRLRPEERPPDLFRKCRELERRVDAAIKSLYDQCQRQLF